MTDLNANAQAMLDAFAAESGGKAGPDYLSLYGAVTESPLLADWFNTAANSGELKSITFSTSSDIITSFDPNNDAIEVSSGYFHELFEYTTNPADPLLYEKVQLAIGHESGHADHAGDVALAVYDWQNNQLSSFMANIDHANDATSVVAEYQNFTLLDEGRANIQGWNDVVSYVGSAGGSLSDAESGVGVYLFDRSTGTPFAGVTVNTDGTIAGTDANGTAAGRLMATLHGSIAGADLQVTYAQIEAANALNQIDSSTNNHSITLNYDELGLDKPATDLPSSASFVPIDTGTVDQRLLEAGLQTSSTAFDISDPGIGPLGSPTTNRFMGTSSESSASVFYAGNAFANEHIVVSNTTHNLQEVDQFDGVSGQLASRDVFGPNSLDNLGETLSFFSDGDPFSSQTYHLDNKGQTLSEDSFDTMTGKLQEHQQYTTAGSGSEVDTIFLNDGGRSVDVLANTANGPFDQESATFSANATHASHISMENQDQSSVSENFSTSGQLTDATSYDKDNQVEQAEQFSNGHLASIFAANISPSITSESWSYDPSSDQLTAFHESGSQPLDWSRESDGSWYESNSQQTSASMPALPMPPALLPTFNADSLLSQSGWITPIAVHSIDGFHF